MYAVRVGANDSSDVWTGVAVPAPLGALAPAADGRTTASVAMATAASTKIVRGIGLSSGWGRDRWLCSVVSTLNVRHLSGRMPARGVHGQALAAGPSQVPSVPSRLSESVPSSGDDCRSVLRKPEGRGG